MPGVRGEDFERCEHAPRQDDGMILVKVEPFENYSTKKLTKKSMVDDSDESVLMSFLLQLVWLRLL